MNIVAEQAERKTGDKETQQMDTKKMQRKGQVVEDLRNDAGPVQRTEKKRRRTVASWTSSASKKPKAEGLKLQVGKRRTVADHRERLENRSVDVREKPQERQRTLSIQGVHWTSVTNLVQRFTDFSHVVEVVDKFPAATSCMFSLLPKTVWRVT